MARKAVVAIDCDRCRRTEYVEQEPELSAPALVITIRGAEYIEYHDLCSNCMEIVTTALSNLTKPMEKKSPVRKKKEASEEEAPAPPMVATIQPMRVPRG